VQKQALLISRILEVDSEAEPYKCGLYSETVTEKLQNASAESPNLTADFHGV